MCRTVISPRKEERIQRIRKEMEQRDSYVPPAMNARSRQLIQGKDGSSPKEVSQRAMERLTKQTASSRTKKRQPGVSAACLLHSPPPFRPWPLCSCLPIVRGRRYHDACRVTMVL